MLEVGEGAEVDVEHVLLGPYCLTSLCGVGVVMSWRGEGEGYLVFVVVALVVTTDSDEEAHLVVLQFRVTFHRIGMDEHLQVLVVAEVHVHGLIHRTGVACGKVFHCECQGLFVLLRELRLGGVEHTGDAWRQDVVDWGLVVVLLDIHGGGHDASAHTGLRVRVEGLRVVAPFSFHQVEVGKTYHDGFFKPCHVQPHETDAGEVTDGSFLAVKFIHRDAELIPRGCFFLAVAQSHSGLTRIYYIVPTDYHVLRTKTDVVLVEVLVLVHRVVGVHIFGIGRTLIGSGVTFSRTTAVG